MMTNITIRAVAAERDQDEQFSFTITFQSGGKNTIHLWMIAKAWKVYSRSWGLQITAQWSTGTEHGTSFAPKIGYWRRLTSTNQTQVDTLAPDGRIAEATSAA